MKHVTKSSSCHVLVGLGFGFASPKVVELMGSKPFTCVNHTVYCTPFPINLECTLTLVQ
jgi:hypothetical protein